MSRLKVSVIGLGKLGLPCAEAMGKHYSVTGYDIYPRVSGEIAITDTLKDAVEGQDIIFIAVPTPHDPEYDGSKPLAGLETKDFDYSIVISLLQEVNRYATKEQLVVLISTVLPGTTRREFVHRIPNARFIYNPYLIAMGSVAWDMVNPEMVIIGTEDGSTTTDAQILIDFYEPLMENNPRMIVGTWDEAESIKIFYNTFISAKIGLVNMIQDVSEKLGNIDVDVVTNALADSDMRIISKKYMTAGMGDAGPCHPRDNIALSDMAKKLDLGYDIFGTVMQSREIQARNLAQRLSDLQDEQGFPIVIHGKAYKPNVSYVDGSYSLLIGHYLEEMNADYYYVDPLTHDTFSGLTPTIVLLAHNTSITYDGNHAATDRLYFTPALYSIIVDPWRTYPMDDSTYEVIHYGNTRTN